MHPPLPLLVPLGSALIYAFAALTLKRATGRGIGPWRVSFVTNWIQAAIFAPYWLTGSQPFSWLNLLHAALTGVTFFLGQVFTFLALSRGDVSVTTPVLGTKVIFVALFATALAAEPLSGAMWVAAVLTTIATALLGGFRAGRAASSRSNLWYGFLAAAAFALTDVLAQKWAPSWGFGHFAPTMFLIVALLSFALVPFFSGPLRALPWRWVAPGATLLGLQATGIAYAIMVFGSATRTNIIYNSRGIWSVLLVWTIGGWFGNVERAQGHAVMARRLVGSTLLLAAIVLVAK
jgi:drug/metabolite transporter (DMT)-like permease